tara:strand:+ start:45 stop:284 length:240 start_codon:yes stop_codon:yes gene_type:complete
MEDGFRFWSGIVILIFGIVLTFIGFFVFFTWIYGIPAIIIGILLLLNVGKEDKIERVKSKNLQRVLTTPATDKHKKRGK